MRDCARRLAAAGHGLAGSRRSAPDQNSRPSLLSATASAGRAAWPTRKRLVERGELVLAQLSLPAAALSAACSALEAFGIANTEGIARQEAERDLARRGAMRVGDFLQQLSRLAARRRKIIVAERRIGDHRDAVLLAPRDHRMLDRAFLQMIEHLVAGDPAFAGDRLQFIEIVAVEIADAPASDLSGARPVPRTPRRSPPADRSRASAADSNRAGRSSAAPANARRP